MRVFAISLGVLCALPLQAQRPKRNAPPLAGGAKPKIEEPSDPVRDSILAVKRDSTMRADSLFRADSVALLKNSSLELPAFSTARDSIVEVFSDGNRNVYYYGDVSVSYQDMTLKAERMDYDMNSGVVYARGVYDTLSGEWIGRPVMTQGSKTYSMEEIHYNFNNRKASISNMITTEDDGILHGRNIKMMPDNSINVEHGKYTVCDREHPHYWMELSVAKVVTKPNRKTVFGPAHLVVGDVHIPIGLPYGFIPKRPERATGMLMPTFGEETARGFFMKDAGMYFVFGDYLDLSLTGDVYTLGSWALDVNSRYKVNYKFNGSFSLNLSNDQTGERGVDFVQMKNFGLKWNHQQDPKSHPGTTFSASVNFSSPKNNTYNSRSVNEALQNQVSSSISYARNWNGKVNFSVNALHSQNSRDSSYTFTLPNISLSVSTFYPFKQKNRVGKEKVYEKISFGYSTSLQNKIGFKASEFEMSRQFMERFQNGMNHNFNIGLPSFQLFKYINVSPSVSYGQNWLFSKGAKTLETVYDEAGVPIRVSDSDGNLVEAKQEVTDAGTGMNAFGITHNYSGSVAMSTRLYGMFNFGKSHYVQAIRHVISPSVSMSFSPDKNTHYNGWRTLDGYYDQSGKYHAPAEYNIYSLSRNNTGGAPSGKESASASFSIGNNLEAKVRDRADTTGTGSKKVKLIDQLNFSSSYDFLRDSLKLSSISASMSTSIFGKISISGSAGFEPYGIVLDGDRINTVNRFAITMGQGLARLSRASASLSYSLSGKGVIEGNDGQSGEGSSGGEGPASYYKRMYYHPVTGEYIPGGWLYYTNPNVPWSVNLSANLSYSKNPFNDSGKIGYKTTVTETLNMSGNIKLTPKMNINVSSGYDFNAKQITTTQLSATYDMHCFNMSLSWVPFGTWQSYSFRIQANAASLADILRFKKSSSYWDN